MADASGAAAFGDLVSGDQGAGPSLLTAGSAPLSTSQGAEEVVAPRKTLKTSSGASKAKKSSKASTKMGKHKDMAIDKGRGDSGSKRPSSASWKGERHHHLEVCSFPLSPVRREEDPALFSPFSPFAHQASGGLFLMLTIPLQLGVWAGQWKHP